MWTLKNLPDILYIVGTIAFVIFIFWAAGQIGDQAHQTIYHRDEAQRKHDEAHEADRTPSPKHARKHKRKHQKEYRDERPV